MNLTKTRVPLYELAHARTGDKGNRSNISVIAYRPEDFAILLREVTAEKVREHFSFRKPTAVQRFAILLREVTAEKVREHFSFRKPTAVQRYELPNLCALNFVMDDVLEGGVNLSLNLDTHGKSLSYWLLAMEIDPS